MNKATLTKVGLFLGGALMGVVGWGQSQNVENIQDLNWGSLGLIAVLASYVTAYLQPNPKMPKILDRLRKGKQVR